MIWDWKGDSSGHPTSDGGCPDSQGEEIWVEVVRAVGACLGQTEKEAEGFPGGELSVRRCGGRTARTLRTANKPIRLGQRVGLAAW